MGRCWGLTFLLTVMVACSHSTSIEHRVGQSIDNCKSDSPCIIRVKDFTDFEWDEMHVFEYGASLDQIEQAIGTSFPDYVEFTRRMVFLNGGKIVHREAEPTDVERVTNGQLVFAESYRDTHWSFTRENAVFKAQKKQSNGATSFALTQVK
ncbi:MAG: hypothetical protein ACREBG_16435 [Pyrinomonadaceae bacterium]